MFFVVWFARGSRNLVFCQPGNSNVLGNRHSHAWLFRKLFYSWIHGLFISASCPFSCLAILHFRKVFRPLHTAIVMGYLKLKARDAVFCCFVATFPVFYLAARTLFCIVYQRVSCPLKLDKLKVSIINR